MEQIHSTTIVCARRGNKVAMGGDGQVTLGSQIIKHSAQKLRKLNDGKIIAGFAGVAADGLSLFEQLDMRLRKSSLDLERLIVELAKDWRSEKIIRRFDAMLVVADQQDTFMLSGTGDVLKPETFGDDASICAIGSGGAYALSAGKALLTYTDMPVRDVAQNSLEIAASICIYTSHHISVMTLEEDS